MEGEAAASAPIMEPILPDPLQLQGLHHGLKATAQETNTITTNTTTASLTGEEEASLMTMITGK